jgi:hypothetical protein
MKSCINCKLQFEYSLTKALCRGCYYQKNKEHILKTKQDFYASNRHNFKQKNTNYYKNNKNFILKEKKSYNLGHKAERKAYNKHYYSLNRERLIAENLRNLLFRRANNINCKLSLNLRSRLNKAIRGNYKSGSAVFDLGCSIEQFKIYMEFKFQSGMTWDNYGLHGWHIDHIKPLSSFNLSDKEELLKACHYSNLQPLWAKENLSKGKNHHEI